MKKMIITMLTLAMIAAVCAVPVCAAEWDGSWNAYQSHWTDWFHTHWGEITSPTEPEKAEETEMPEETEPVIVEYTIRYDANGGYWWSQYASPATTNSKSYLVDAGDTHKVISAPQRTCYSFRGWEAIDGTIYQPGDKIVPTENMTLKAIWAYNG